MIVEVPWQEIAPETLDALIGEFVTRDGTDYGEREVPLERKVSQVREKLRRGEALVVFFEESQAVDILAREEFNARLSRTS